MRGERWVWSAGGGNAHRGAQVPLRRDRRSDGSFVDAAGLCAGVLPKICGAGFAVAGDNLFWLEPAQSVDRLAAGHGDRTAAGQLERTDGAAGAVRHRENDYRVSRVVDRRSTRYRAPGGPVCVDADVLSGAPGVHCPYSAFAARLPVTLLHTAPALSNLLQPHHS